MGLYANSLWTGRSGLEVSPENDSRSAGDPSDMNFLRHKGKVRILVWDRSKFLVSRRNVSKCVSIETSRRGAFNGLDHSRNGLYTVVILWNGEMVILNWCM